VGEGRRSGSDRTTTDQPTGRRLTVPEAAEALGISEDAVRSRIKRGTLETEHEGTRVFVVLGGDDRPTDRARPTQRPDARDELVDEMRERIVYLERQVEEEREARRRADTLLARLMDRVPELEAPSEAPTEARASSVSPGPSDNPTQTHEDARGTAELSKPRFFRWVYLFFAVVLAAISTFGLTYYGAPLVIAALAFSLLVVGFIRGLIRGHKDGVPFRQGWRTEALIGAIVGMVLFVAAWVQQSILLRNMLRDLGSSVQFSDSLLLLWLTGYVLLQYGIVPPLFYVSGFALGNAFVPRNTSETRGTAALGSQDRKHRDPVLWGFLGVVLASVISAAATIGAAAFFGNAT
jgi:hypothetical protein